MANEQHKGTGMSKETRTCPGTGAIGDISQNSDYCPQCGRTCRVQDDGTIARHPFRYPEVIKHLAQAVESLAPWAFGSSIR